jgi:hypothetical protein
MLEKTQGPPLNMFVILCQISHAPFDETYCKIAMRYILKGKVGK